MCGRPTLRRAKDRMKTLIQFVALFALLVLIGCGDSSDSLARIKREGVLKWGSDPSGGAPFVFTDPKDPSKTIGFEVEIMDTFAKHLGVKHEIVRTQWDALLDNLLSKRCDIVINGMEINDERKKKVGFSEPYYMYEQQITVRLEDKDKIKKIDDLKGKNVGTLSGAEANNVLKAAGFTDAQLKGHPDSLTPYDDLKFKRVDGVLQESIIAAHYAGKDAALYNVPETFAPGRYGIAVRPEDKTLLVEVDRILKLMKENGELAAIYKKWNIHNEKQKEVGVVAK